MASKAQRAVTDIPPEDPRWARFGKALQEWREDELGYQIRGKFAEDRYVNLRLVQDLEKNYRPGTFTKWALQDAAQAYKITYKSMLAVLHGDADTFVPASRVPPARQLSAPGALPPAPLDRAREEAARPYAEPIWARFVLLRDVRGIADPAGEQIAAEPDGTRIIRIDGTPLMTADDISVFDGSRGAMDDPDRVWLVGDLHASREARRANPASAASAS